MRYESEVLYDLMKRDGLLNPSQENLPYESELKEKYVDEVKGAYPKVTDYRPEWLNYNLGYYIPADFPTESLVNVTSGTVNNVIPYAYKSAILKGNTLVNCIKTKSYGTTTWPTITLENVLVQPNKKYIAILKHLPVDCQWAITNVGEQQNTHVPYNKAMYSIFTSSSTTTTSLKLHINKGGQTDLTLEELQKVHPMIIEYIEGMENWDIPYFEGMQSVQMPVLTTTNEDGTKSNILTVNEEVELGSVGEVKDELDLLTGKITQRTETRPYQEGDELNSEFATDMTNTRYKLAQEVVKTVDLNNVNQDGVPSTFRPFEGTMHVETDGEPLKPLLYMEIPVEATTQNLASFIDLEGVERNE